MKQMKKIFKENPFYLAYARKRYHYDDVQLNDFINHHFQNVDDDFGRIKRAMKVCYIYGGVRYNEFFAHHLEKLKWKERRKLIPCSAQNNLYIQVNPQDWEMLANKNACYSAFKQYYQREVLPVSKTRFGDVDLVTEFFGFVERHPNFILKPISSAGGKGVRLINVGGSREGKENSLRRLFDEYPNGFIIEEKIIQVGEFARFHESSVNTVRIQTINYGDCIEVKWPCLRMGTGQSVVDNASNGGLFVAINVENGRLFKIGKDELGHDFFEHPDSRVQFDGVQIPRWTELCDLVKGMAQRCPNWKIIGWDMALTEKGWVVVEANGGPELIYQFFSGEGFYDDFLSVRKRLGVKRFKGYRWIDKQFMPVY